MSGSRISLSSICVILSIVSQLRPGALKLDALKANFPYSEDVNKNSP